MLRPASSRTWAQTGRDEPPPPRGLRLDAVGTAAGGCCGAVLRALHAPASAQRAACAGGAASAGIAALSSGGATCPLERRFGGVRAATPRSYSQAWTERRCLLA
jgi:hypothetical protein